MTHHIYNAIAQTELEFLTFRGNVTQEPEGDYIRYEVEWHDGDEKKVKIEIIYENGGVVGCVLQQEGATDKEVKKLMDAFMEKLQCDTDQMDVDWQPIPMSMQVAEIPMLSG